jgi:DNA primase
VSFPVSWDELERIRPSDFTVHTAIDTLAGRDPWADALPAPQRIPDDLIELGRTIPVARVAAMHEGKRRARSRRAEKE